MIEETEEEKLRNSQQYEGFKKASSLLGESNGKIDRSFFFGKTKLATTKSNDQPSKFKLLYTFHHDIPGMKNEYRDKFVSRLSEKLNEKLSDSIKKALSVSIEKLAIEVEGECYKNCKLMVLYQDRTHQQLRKLNKFEFDENWFDAKVDENTYFYHVIKKNIKAV